jgi:hypothetical protein
MPVLNDFRPSLAAHRDPFETQVVDASRDRTKARDVLQ